jgi:hypothetical protein
MGCGGTGQVDSLAQGSRWYVRDCLSLWAAVQGLLALVYSRRGLGLLPSLSRRGGRDQ